MSTYESDPNKWDGSLNTGAATPTKADPVGKVYGTKPIGGAAGNLNAEGAYQEVVFEITSDTLALTTAATISIPAYSRVTECFVVVDDAFGAGDAVKPQLDGNDLTTASIAVATAGVITSTLTATDADRVTGATAEDLTVVCEGVGYIDSAGHDGKCRVIVRYVTA